MTIINQILELSGANNEKFRRYLLTLTEEDLAERLARMREEAGREFRGWKPGELHFRREVADCSRGAAEPRLGNSRAPGAGAVPELAGPVCGEGGLPDLGEILRRGLEAETKKWKAESGKAETF